MKKLIAVFLAVALCLSLGAPAFAAEDTLLIAPAPGAAGVNVIVTISDAGELVLVQAPVYVTDKDEDGVVTINDALIAAHEQYYEGEDGYVFYISDYGIAIDTLWGVQNGGSYMYYVNDLMPMSLGEAVKEGDSIVAYGFADLEYWSDTYSFFDKKTADAKYGENVELTLSTPDWEGNILPAAGAAIYVDGVDTGVVTDENGKASVPMTKVGACVISAKSDTMTLVPPVCTALVAFSDVNEDTPHAYDIEYILRNGLINGFEGGEYGPEELATRAGIVGYLWKMEGAPVVNYALQFEDIDTDAWYADMFRWAVSEGLIEGYSDSKCGPLDQLNREQAAVILWRYAKYKGIDVSAGEDNNILSYNDVFEVSDWAIPAIQWAAAVDVIETEENILPAAAIDRGELAHLVRVIHELI